MEENYTEGELATAERLSVGVEGIRLILDTYNEECARLSRERREQKRREHAAQTAHP